MKAKNVKVGLRVQLKSKIDNVPQGALGTITEVFNFTACVHWDDPVVDGWGCSETNVPHGYGWAVGVEDLRKVKE